ncbi:MAG: hypothetical protein QMC89_04160 [Candidatus Hodarchaeaceae archaeon]|nr:hypothetical protein [Candidatus Hodarchaeaceae archaeon]
MDWSKRYELGYLIGARLSDASPVIGKRCNNYGLETASKDKDYALELARVGTKAHQKDKPYVVRRYAGGHWRVYVSGGELAELLSMDLMKLKPFIEGDAKIAKGVTRSFFDGDGSVGGRNISAYGDRETLEFIVGLLRKHFMINAYVLSKPVYRLHIPRRYWLDFYEEIGFAIRRKQRVLAELIKERKVF